MRWLVLHWQRMRYRRKTGHRLMQWFLLAKLPNRHALVKTVDFLAVDLETTMLDPQQGEIVSIGWVPIADGKVILAEAVHHHVAISAGVGQSATFHQISDSELSGAHSIAWVLEKFLTAAAGRVLVFHNASLDISFLNRVFCRIFNVPLVAPVVDTLLLEKQKLLRIQEALAPGELRLFACRDRYGLPGYPVHNALIDAIATAELLLAQCAHRGKTTVLGELI